MKSVFPLSDIVSSFVIRGSVKPTLRRPYCFGRPGASRYFPLPRPSEIAPRARGTPMGPNGPAGLDASRHRGLSKSALLRAFGASQGVTASPPVPRRPVHGVYRLAPQGPRWASIVRRLAFRQGRQTTAWRSPAWGDRSACGLDRRAVSPHLRRNVISRPPLPAPCLKMLAQTPLGNEAGWL